MSDDNEKHLEETVIRIAAERGGVAPADVSRQTHFRDDLNFDSLDVVEMAMALEEAFNCSIPDNDLETFQTVDDVIDHVRRRLSDAPAAM